MLKNIILSLIPLFVAVDAIGTLPIFLSFSYLLNKKDKIRIILQSIFTAILLTICFVFFGRLIFSFLNINIADFMIAGGIILFCLAITEIINPQKHINFRDKDFGIVPLGTPLIAGPAVLTTSLLMISEYGVFPTLVSIITNIMFAGFIFYFSDIFIKILGKSGLKAISKITSLLLGAIAVMMIRKGITVLFNLRG